MAFLGDSINHLVANAAECFAAADGELWQRGAEADAAAHVTVLNAGCAAADDVAARLLRRLGSV